MVSEEATLSLPAGPLSAPAFTAKDSLALWPVGPDIFSQMDSGGRERERRADGVVERAWGLQLGGLAYSHSSNDSEFSLRSCHVLSTVLRSLPALFHKILTRTLRCGPP